MPRAIPRDRYVAVLLDLDGVITDTATIHTTCWQQMFDAYLRQRAVERGEPFRPVEIATDYRRYVDGKPRFDSVRDFLASRSIPLPVQGPWPDPCAHRHPCVGPRLATPPARVQPRRRDARSRERGASGPDGTILKSQYKK